jgi:hypothetical protein
MDDANIVTSPVMASALNTSLELLLNVIKENTAIKTKGFRIFKGGDKLKIRRNIFT